VRGERRRPGVGVENGEAELIFGGVEVDEEVVDFVEDYFGAGIGAVDLIEDDDGGQLGPQGLLKHIARLRERAFAGVNEKEDAVHHAQGALDFAAEVAVAGGVDDIDFGVAVKEGGVFGENGDAALALEVARVHDAVGDDLIVAEDAALTKHGVHKRGLAVVHVGDDGDVADRLCHTCFISLPCVRPANERGCRCDLAAPGKEFDGELLTKSNKRKSILAQSAVNCLTLAEKRSQCAGRNSLVSCKDKTLRFFGHPKRMAEG